ncbi:PREDICTED: uncharacterized protein LOC106128407 isoform X1 [Papilio xuthus]|uniref:Uncharacterized protein LOC106128407 isoform X1 n=1 Tax=Papilio xuthus TaxID=66420 RepID=A0AAJ6ZYV0_PAPXU|nr:PREDICTED: uncharacterized protein LOC106128407 isoform X1 [Papilio xuthus]
MDVAGQWRREWAGTAEYGKVTEGGVTKRVARAMEVLHASAPGARVRVLRAAYHSTAGPGVPASSYMLQSSRRVISSGYDFVEPTSLPSKPLEISSIPLETIDSDVENQNYKVTEPDDLDISEPSKWRSGVVRNSIRMPSEESSSADNASIIDLDSRTNRRNSFKSHVFEYNEDRIKPNHPKNNRVSPLLDAPVTLSTLKYKSLLNGSDDWNNRRKSYSFEDTAPLNKIILDRKDRFAIESSTDSGICKSSEIVNDVDSARQYKKDRKSEDETFKDWLYKNRASHAMKTVKEHSVTPDRLSDNNITLQSSGKVCITLPVAIETENGYEYRKSPNVDENDRKSKKVEFCKTELHFAADTGTVNIIATDEKPPPTNDFRRRRSAFVPISDRFEKSVTLFGEKTDFHGIKKSEYFSSYSTNDVGDSDENTAATKSILKNKIPKPKPYLLGENMSLGDDDNVSNVKNGSVDDNNVISGVTLVNAQLQADKIYCNETRPSYSTNSGSTAFLQKSYRTTNEGTFRQGSFRKTSTKPVLETSKHLQLSSDKDENLSTNSVKRKLQIIQKSPTLGISNTRQLKESDLMYFGIAKDRESEPNSLERHENKLYDKNNEQEEIFESVRLVRKISSSVCSSDMESDDAPEYQNILYKTNYTPVPAPRGRNQYDIEIETRTRNLNSIEEQDNDDVPTTLRRSRLRRQETSSSSSRSISEPPKARLRHKELNSQKISSRNSPSLRMKRNDFSKELDIAEETVSKDSSSLYVNLRPKERHSTNDKKDIKQQPRIKLQSNITEKNNTIERVKARNTNQDEDGKKKVVRSDSLRNKINVNESSPTRKTRVQRTEKLVTPELPHSGRRNRIEESICDKSKNTTREKDLTYGQKDHRIRSLHRHAKPVPDTNNSLKKQDTLRVDTTKDFKENFDIKHITHPTINNNLTSIQSKPSPKSKNKIPENYHDTKKSRRSEYVINYDDKEGTVSSVRKVRPKHGSEIKSRSAKENKENATIEHNVRIKQINKIALRK